MKLLFDQNLSRHLVEDLGKQFPDIRHVTSLGLASAPDEAIWAFARDNGYAIVSKDADFHHLSFRYGAPPKTIWLKLGNCSTHEVSQCIGRNLLNIARFLADDDSALMIITVDSVETRSSQS